MWSYEKLKGRVIKVLLKVAKSFVLENTSLTGCLNASLQTHQQILWFCTVWGLHCTSACCSDKYKNKNNTVAADQTSETFLPPHFLC